MVADVPHTITVGPRLPVPRADAGTLLAKGNRRCDGTHHSENPFPCSESGPINSPGMKLPHPGSHAKLLLAELGGTDAA